MRNRRFTTTVKTVYKIFFHVIRRDQERMNNAIFAGFNELGGVYVKFLQILTLKSDFFTKVDQGKLMAVYDDVEADDLDLDFILNFELGDKTRFFKSIAPKPFAAGSFGQVYKATLHDDRPVIIKVLRPSLMQNLRFDLNLLGLFTGIIKFVVPSAVYDVNAVYRDFRKVVKEETDYIKEADHALHFWNRYKGHPHIVIPYTYKDLSSKYVITQDYLGGIAATTLIERRENGEDITALVKGELGTDLAFLTRMFGFELLYSVLTADLIQGDPHPGNLKVLPGNKIGLIDFGITAPPPEDRMAFFQVIKSYINLYHGDADMGKFFFDGLRFYVNDLFRAIVTISRLYERDKDRNFDLSAEVKKVAVAAFDSSKDHVNVRQMLAKGQLSRLFEQTINEDNRFGLKITFDGGVMLRAAATYMSIIEGFGYREEMMPSVFEEVIKAIEDGDVQLTSKPDTMDVDRAVEIVSEWIEDITERDPLLFRELIGKMRHRLENE